ADGARAVRDRRGRGRDPRLQGGDGRAHQSRLRPAQDRGLRRAGRRHPAGHRGLGRGGGPARAPGSSGDGVKPGPPRIALIQGAGVLVALATWEALARGGWVDPLFVPAPTAVVRSFGSVGDVALGGLADTLAKTALAYGLSIVLGVAAGLVLGSARVLGHT